MARGEIKIPSALFGLEECACTRSNDADSQTAVYRSYNAIVKRKPAIQSNY